MSKKKGTSGSVVPRSSLFAGTKVRGQGGIWKHDQTTIGATIIGVLTGSEKIKFKASGNKKNKEEGEALNFGPVVMHSADGEVTAHETLSTIRSAALESRVDPAKDVGKVFVIQHTGFGKADGAPRTFSPFKTFEVAESTVVALNTELKDAGRADLAVKGSPSKRK